MHGANGVIEFFQQVVGIVERSVRQNIHLGRFQHTDANQARVQFIDEANLLPEVLNRDAASDLQALRMIRDADVLISEIPGRSGHLFDRMGSVA